MRKRFLLKGILICIVLLQLLIYTGILFYRHLPDSAVAGWLSKIRPSSPSSVEVGSVTGSVTGSITGSVNHLDIDTEGNPRTVRNVNAAETDGKAGELSGNAQSPANSPSDQNRTELVSWRILWRMFLPQERVEVIPEPQEPEELPEEPPQYDMERFQYIGHVLDSHGDQRYFFKDTLYNDVLALSEEQGRAGFEIDTMDAEGEYFILKKDDQLYKVRMGN